MLTWLKYELDLLRDTSLSIEELCELMPKRTRNAILIRRRRLLHKRQNRRWLREEQDILKKYYGVLEMEELQKLLPKRTPDAIRSQVTYLKSCGWSFEK